MVAARRIGGGGELFVGTGCCLADAAMG